MGFEIPGTTTDTGEPVGYWALRDFAARDEEMKAVFANREDWGPLRLIPGTSLARVAVVQMAFEGYASREAAKSGARAVERLAVPIVGRKAEAIWSRIKAGEPAYPELYAALKEFIDGLAAVKAKHRFVGMSGEV